MMNDEPDQFERRLSRQPLRQVPQACRGDILLAAERASRPVPRTSFLSTFNHQLSTIFWPHPKAWAGLATVWIFIFAVNFTIRDTSPRIAEKAAPASPEMIVELKKQQRMFAELAGLHELADTYRPKIFLPRPRSARVEILTT